MALAATTNIPLVLAILTFTIGQTIRIELFGASFPLIDIFLPLLALTNFITRPKNNLNKTSISFLVFLIIAISTLILNLALHGFDPTRPVLYFIRLVSLISFFIYPLTISPSIRHLLIYALIANILTGYIQYYFWPDFTYFDASHWDPHLYRLVSTFFDPTFTALIYLLFIFHLFSSNIRPRIKYPIIVLTYFALALTYSRSTLLSLFFCLSYLAFSKRNIRIFVFAIILIFSTAILLPRKAGEGTKLERSSSILAKIENYKLALNTVVQSPLTGFGYNTISQLGLSQPHSRASSGFDSSLLTVWATTGLLGLFFFIKSFFYIWQDNPGLIRLSLIAIFIHSLFANSWLYPWVLFYLALLYSIYRK